MTGISISIAAGLDEATSSVKASGSIQHIITDKERKTFGIQDGDIKKAVEKYFDKRPNDAYVCSPTPWDDLYKTYNWDEVQTVLTVKDAKIREITSEPVVISKQTLTNNSNKKATFQANISEEVANTTESNWSTTNTIEVKQEFEYEVKFLGTGGKGTTSISYNHQWGEGGSKSKTITVGSSRGLSVELDPYESVEALLTATRGVMKIRIIYEAHLIGDTAVNYNPRYKDHHFWCFSIDNVMRSAGINNSLEFTEDIEVGYYSDAQVELRNTEGNKLRAAFSI